MHSLKTTSKQAVSEVPGQGGHVRKSDSSPDFSFVLCYVILLLCLDTEKPVCKTCINQDWGFTEWEKEGQAAESVRRMWLEQWFWNKLRKGMTEVWAPPPTPPREVMTQQTQDVKETDCHCNHRTEGYPRSQWALQCILTSLGSEDVEVNPDFSGWEQKTSPSFLLFKVTRVPRVIRELTKWDTQTATKV